VLIVAIALLGGVGALARFGLDGAVSGRRLLPGFPLGTLAVNLSGAFVLGVLSGAGLAGDALTLAGTALIGSYTTFSTWMLESQRLGEDGQPVLLWANIGVSMLAGLAVFAAAHALGAAL
jgi:CrcB protein